MSKAIEIRKIEVIEKKEALLGKGIIEDLTRQGRVVTVWEGIGRGEDSVSKAIFHVFIPPQGVTFGDKVHQFRGGGYQFFVAGRSMGLAEIIEVSKKESEQILLRRNKTLESLGRKEMPAYQLIDDDEAFRLNMLTLNAAKPSIMEILKNNPAL
jgi:hypothetical protein